MILTKLARGRDDLVLAVDLLNTWDVMADPPEQLRDVDRLRRLLAWHGHDRAAAVATEDDVAAARALRERLREAFEAPTEEKSVAVLNDLLREHPAEPQLVGDDGEWRLRVGPPEDSPAFLAPATAFALLEAIRGGGWERFGHCEADPCRCVFVDRSRSRSRRYCCQYCADRAHQAASRARRAAAWPQV